MEISSEDLKILETIADRPICVGILDYSEKETKIYNHGARDGASQIVVWILGRLNKESN